jgi:hypothetical protein
MSFEFSYKSSRDGHFRTPDIDMMVESNGEKIWAVAMAIGKTFDASCVDSWVFQHS